MANPLAGMDYEQYTSGFSKLRDVVESTKHHITWMISAAVIGLTLSIPHAVSSAIEAFEALQTKIMQNMELAKQYENNPQKLHGDMDKMGQAAKTFAQSYGMSIQEVQEGMQIITRRFKDAGTAIYLTNIALQMSKLDMVDVKQSAKDLEAVMLQFNMGAKDANKFLNDFSVICHVARISGTDMLMALERSGSAFKAMNMDARAAMAAIAAVSTVTGKSGATIGDSWKSILANMDFKKATQALETYHIKLYDVQQNGTKTMRNGTAVLADILRQFK
jgi:TP901 family phage tail tape measure protein